MLAWRRWAAPGWTARASCSAGEGCETLDLPAPESAHAVHATLVEAERCRETGEEKTLMLGLSGHALLDPSGRRDLLSGEQVYHNADTLGWLAQSDPR